MKTVKVPIEVKKMLEEYGQGKSINKVIKELLDNTTLDKCSDEHLGYININMDDKYLDEIKEYRVYSSETNASVIYRLLQNQKK